MDNVLMLLGFGALLVTPILGWKGKGFLKPAANVHKVVGFLAGGAVGFVVLFVCAAVAAGMDNETPLSASGNAATQNASEGPKKYPSGTWTVAIRSFDCRESDGRWDVGCEWAKADLFGHVSIGDERVEVELVDDQSLRIVEVETGRLTDPVLEIEVAEDDVFGGPRAIASKRIPIEENEGKWTRVDGAAVLVRFGENRKSPDAIGNEAMAAIADWSMKEVDAACSSRGAEACQKALRTLSDRLYAQVVDGLAPRYKAVFANVLAATVAQSCSEPVDVAACSTDLKLVEWIADKYEETLPDGFASSVAESKSNLAGATGAAFEKEATQKARRVGKRVSFPTSTLQVLKATTFKKWKNTKRQDGEFCPYAYVVPEKGHYFVRLDLKETNKSNEVETIASRSDGLGVLDFKLIDSQGNSADVSQELLECFHRAKTDALYDVGTGRSITSTLFFEVPASVDKRSLLLQADVNVGTYGEPVEATEFLRLFKGS